MDMRQRWSQHPCRGSLGSICFEMVVAGSEAGGCGGVHGQGRVISWSGGTVTSITTPSLVDFWWFNAAVPVSRASVGSLDEKPFAVALASFPFSPFPTLCRSLP